MTKIRPIRIFLVAAALTTAIAGCSDNSCDSVPPAAATNSFLESCVRDLLGCDTAVLRLAEPGMCPGHFDIRPSQVQKLSRCRILLRMDFQDSLDSKLGIATDRGLKIAGINIPGGLCEPDSYISACRQTSAALIEAGLLDSATAENRLAEIERRVKETASRYRKLAEPLKGTPVLASVHQAAFCRWLGLDVVDTFTGADTAQTSRFEDAYKAGKAEGAKIIVANLPEGRQAADALAEKLKAKVVVFGNFPALNGGQEGFDDMLADNVNSLLEAAGK